MDSGYFYRSQVQSYSTHVSESLTNWRWSSDDIVENWMNWRLLTTTLNPSLMPMLENVQNMQNMQNEENMQTMQKYAAY